MPCYANGSEVTLSAHDFERSPLLRGLESDGDFALPFAAEDVHLWQQFVDADNPSLDNIGTALKVWQLLLRFLPLLLSKTRGGARRASLVFL